MPAGIVFLDIEKPWVKQRIATVVVVTLLGVLAAVRIVDTYSELNATYDEGYHVAAGLQAYQEGRFDVGADQPPLVRWALGLLPHWAGIEYRSVRHFSETPGAAIEHLSRVVFEGQGDYWETLKLARLGNLIFLPFLLLYTYLWARSLFGPQAGWAACALVTLSPSILGHAALATVDFGTAVCLLVAGYHLWRWLRQPALREALPAGCAVGLAVAAKYSAPVFLPAMLAGLMISGYRAALLRPRTWQLAAIRRAARSLIPAAGLAVLVVWGAFLFEVRPLRDPARRPYDRLEQQLPEPSRLKTAIYWTLENVPWPLQDLASGVGFLAHHAERGHPAFLLGEVSKRGWWYYFPVVVGTKTSVPFLLLVFLAGFLTYRRAVFDKQAVAPLAAALGILLAAAFSPINVGVRHILPLYPLLAIWASSSLAPRAKGESRIWAILALLLIGWHGVESLRAHPDYLPYFNQIARGREYEILGDSNLDWGQDLHRLARYVKRNGIEDLSLNYFGTTSPEAVGLHAYRRFGPQDRPRGWVAISVTEWQGIYQPRPAWLDDYEPRARIGKSIWLYFIE